MAWEPRRGGGKYYYRSRRIDGKVVKEYIGTGAEAERIAEQDRQAREQRRRQREEVKALEAKLAATQKHVDGLIERTELMLAAYLLTAGFHCHRSEWRQKNDCTKHT